MKGAAATILVTMVCAFFAWAASEFWEQNVWASDLEPIERNQEQSADKLQSIERILLKREIRDVSTDIRALERAQDSDDWTERDQERLDDLLDDLDDLQDELDNLTK